MNIHIITLFPDMFKALDYGISGRALKQGLVQFSYWNPRDFTEDKHRTVDDRPYGGGPGMLLKIEPIQKAIAAAKEGVPESKVIYPSPQGRSFTQTAARELSARSSIIFLAGRYEGIDERLIQSSIDEEWSIGDYVLSGGELAIMVMLDAMIRLLPNALHDKDSATRESFSEDLLDYPQYTRPEVMGDQSVPEVLLSGNHQAIERWRTKQALGQTWLKRPDLLKDKKLDKLQQLLLDEFIREYQSEETKHEK